jgi:hypothetical protein
MLFFAFWVLSVTVGLGAFLAFMYLRAKPVLSSVVAISHGSLGAFGIIVLTYALSRGPIRGVAYGASSFGLVAVVLGGLAVLLGLGIALLTRRSNRRVGLIIGVHASVAIAAYILLMTYVSFS